MALKAKEVKDAIANELSPKMIVEGFAFKKASNLYQLVDGDFSYFYRIEQVRWSDHYSIDVHLEISQSKIEGLESKILGKRRHSITMGEEIGKIKLSPDGRKIINGSLAVLLLFEKDIEACVETLFDYYTEIAKPYFNRYRSLDAIDDIMNNEPFDHCPAHIGGMFYERCMKGLIVAKLIDNPRYNDLVKIYDSEIKETYNEVFISDYYKVRDYLATMK